VRTIGLITALLATDAVAGPKKATQLAPGTPAPVFKLRAIDGTMVRLDELAYEGKEKKWAKKRPIFLDFFRTDCEPCKKAMPDLVAIHQKYASQGLEVVLIAILEEKDGKAKLESYLAQHKLPFKVVVDPNNYFAKLYLGDLVTLPASFLIGRDGVLRKVKYGATGTYDEHFKGEIEKALAEHKSAT
jgi:peroxiredoxin